MQSKPSVDPIEIAKFSALANEWWDPNGPMKPLHQLNPLRLQYLQNHALLEDKNVLDIGCGGGLLSEAMASCGANVTGIDLSEELINVAKQHATMQTLLVDYRHVSSTELAAQLPQAFDIITCMELLEHVPDPAQLIRECSLLLKPEGVVFFATLTRNLRSFLGAIVAAEYLLKLLPKGTHQYEKFIRPSELTKWANQNHLTLKGLQGIIFNPFSGKFHFSKEISINYLAYFQNDVVTEQDQ